MDINVTGILVTATSAKKFRPHYSISRMDRLSLWRMGSLEGEGERK